MKAPLLVSALAIAGCQAPPAALPEPPPVPTVIIVRPPAEPRLLPPVASVADLYAAVAQREAGAVTAPHVTAGYVSAVHAADLDARAALTILNRQKTHPTAAALSNARAAVRKLDDVLSATP